MSKQKQTLSIDDATLPLYVGTDVGGTGIKVGLVDDQGRPLAFHRADTNPENPAEESAKRIGETVLQVIETAGAKPDQVARVGLATPGPMDIPAGLLLKPGNLPNWWNFPIRDRVSHYCNLPVTFVNDANAASYGEYWQGAGQQYKSIVLLTLGTGIGGGIIVDEMIIDGEHGCGSECGHVIVDHRKDARIDSLGKTGSLESYCGAYSIIARTEEALDEGRESSLSGLRDKITPLLLARHAEKGDELAREIIMETAYYLAIGIVTLVHTIDPNSVVLGGAMNFGGAGHPLGEEFLAAIQKEAKPRMLEPLRDKVKIEFATLGADAGFIGAAGIARLDHKALKAE